MMPNSVWNIHAKVVAATIPGTIQGMSVTERTKPRPRKVWFSITSTINAGSTKTSPSIGVERRRTGGGPGSRPACLLLEQRLDLVRRAVHRGLGVLLAEQDALD